MPLVPDSVDVPARAGRRARRVSTLASELLGSAILKIAGEIRALTASGRQVCNLTVGDFSPREFPVPELLVRATQDALANGETNYPPSSGIPALRDAVRSFTREWLGLDFPAESVLVTGGARPALYAAYRTLVDPGDRVVYPVPSWNNPYYVQLIGAQGVPVVCEAATSFLPTRTMLEPVIRGARLLVVNSPLNPAGSVLDAAALGEICDLVLEENARRGPDERPLYLLYDQIYWMLTFGDRAHVTPAGLRPEIAPYVVLVDGISKAFAATGLRVGWALGPADVIGPMSDLVGHVGAWAPRPEQVATAKLLASRQAITDYHRTMKHEVQRRLGALYDGIMAMKQRGLAVDAVPPAGAIYLSARFNVRGMRTPDGEVLRDNEAIRRYLLTAADFAAVPFQAFGVEADTGWFRLSVGAVSLADITAVLPKVSAALEKLTGTPEARG
ncbi:MAG: aminotransferase class I/II-fold pyridoxal phosphate-dependent enzyme [Gemmatimonadaceae bacterium]|nr:aminotransferase class I/II-fold pyridoxal phosphate-dependent enzyme [Gemmatimonadaceae bacterium]